MSPVNKGIVIFISCVYLLSRSDTRYGQCTLLGRAVLFRTHYYCVLRTHWRNRRSSTGTTDARCRWSGQRVVLGEHIWSCRWTNVSMDAPIAGHPDGPPAWRECQWKVVHLREHKNDAFQHCSCRGTITAASCFSLASTHWSADPLVKFVHLREHTHIHVPLLFT